MLKNAKNKFICPKCGVLLPSNSNKCDYCGYESSLDSEGLIPVSEFSISNDTAEEERQILEFPSIFVLIIGLLFVGVAYVRGLCSQFDKNIYLFMIFGGFIVFLYVYQLLYYGLICLFSRYRQGYLITPLKTGNYIQRSKAEFYDEDSNTVYTVSTTVSSLYESDPRFMKLGYPVWFKTNKTRIIILHNKKCPSSLFSGYFKSLLAAGEEDSGNDD